MATILVNSPGDFMWKPKYRKNKKLKPALIQSRNGMGVVQSIKIGTLPQREVELEFESSQNTYKAIEAFLASKGYGHLPFTWRDHLTNVLYTVKQVGDLDIITVDDNTPDQDVLSVAFKVKFIILSDVQGL